MCNFLNVLGKGMISENNKEKKSLFFSSSLSIQNASQDDLSIDTSAVGYVCPAAANTPLDTSSVMRQGPSPMCTGTGAFLGGRYSMEDVVAFGGIQPKDAGVRSSERIRLQPNADASQMERAQILAQAKNACPFSGTSTHSKFSLVSLSNDTFISRAAKLGVSLGDSPSKVSKTIRSIKDNDCKRTIILLTKNLEGKSLGADQQQASIIDQATDMSLDLIEEGFQVSEETNDISGSSKLKKVYKRKHKVVPKVVRRSVRLSNKKS
jgi:hypothetical protein